MIKKLNILYIHSNSDLFLSEWHLRRVKILKRWGYKVTLINMTDFIYPVMFPTLNKLFRKKDINLMRLYTHLELELNRHDILIHFGGALIHPDYLDKFSILKVYHCADDPDASENLSKPVASGYDICAISNPSVIEIYKDWGCKNVKFWPLGGIFFGENTQPMEFYERPNDFVFLGSKYGIPRFRYLSKIPLINQSEIAWNKKSFFRKIQRTFPEFQGYGSYWKNGFLANNKVNDFYNRSKIGINLHNTIGPINTRLYDLPAHGILQICDNKSRLNQVFKLDHEIVGYENVNEAIDLMIHYRKELDEAKIIAEAGRSRYMKNYTQESIMRRLLKIIDEN
ncbi:glycosyltransferase [Balneolaceae bacterium]|nr:glycosyltransferase [Balneolaceae bacterium]